MIQKLTLFELVTIAKHRLDNLIGSPYITKSTSECVEELDEVLNEIKNIKLAQKYTIQEIRENGWSPENK